MHRIRAVMGMIGTGTVIVAQICVLISAFVGTADVVSALLSQYFPMAVEIMESMMVVVVLLPMVYVQQQDKHIRIELLAPRMPPWMITATNILALLGGFLLTAFLSYRTAIFAWQSSVMGEVAAGIILLPVYPFKWAACIGMTLLSIQLFLDLVLITRTGRSPSKETLVMDV